MRTRMRNQFPRRREIHVDDDVDARARVPSSPSPTPTLARARGSSSTRTPLASSRDDDTEASNGIRRRARAPTRAIAARARACSSPFSTSHVTSHEPVATRVAIDRRSRWEKGKTQGGTRGRVTTGGGMGGWSSSRPSRRRHRRGTGDRARGLTSSTRGSWRGRDPSIESIDRDETHARKKAHRVDRVDRVDRSSRSVGGMWNGASRACAVWTRRRMNPRRDSSSTSGAVVEAAAARRDATGRAGGTF